MIILRWIAFALWLTLSCSALAGSITPIEFDTPRQEKRYQYLITILRCPTCQNQAISDSNALIAQDLREIVAEQIKQGKTDDEIIEFMRQRYGDFISYQPPMSGMTLVIWVAPIVIMLLGLIWLYRKQKNRPVKVVNEAELAKLEAELNKDD